SKRHLCRTVAGLASSALALTVLGTVGATAAPAAPHPALSGADVPLCNNWEGYSDIVGTMVDLHVADPRWSGVVKLTNTSKRACVMYGPADVRTDDARSANWPVFTKLTTGVLGDGIFSTDREHGTVLQPGQEAFQPVAWLSSPSVAPQASCTLGSLLDIVRNGEEFDVAVRVPATLFCPSGKIGSTQIQIGVPQPTLEDAQAQLQGL
ncbi:DUF4232 domain-containing protein, partial [Kitasatospora sp. RB6PN24]|uniref:DUF4232 domain-containing protein n=1 Tax=Kitasatospora humi TaxID=2893891 RepID=UPI001E588DDC